MPAHRVQFSPSGRSTLITEGASLLRAAELASEPMRAECGGRGACGRCLVRILDGQVPEYRVLRREAGSAEVLACLTRVHGPLTVQPLVEAQLPKLVSGDRYIGVQPLAAWAPWPLALAPLVECHGAEDLGVALDIGTTTLRLLLIRLSDGTIVGEAWAYNPQISKGADVISRIVAAEKGCLGELAAAIREAVVAMALEAAGGLDPGCIRGYVVAGNVTMIHLLLGEDPSGIRRVPSEPRALAFSPVDAQGLGWPGRADAPVYTVPGAGGWVGGDILAGAVRAGFSRAAETALYVDLGTNGEIVFGNADFALACACSAGPAFEGGGIRCGMRADRGAVDGAAIDAENGAMELSVIGGGSVRGLCGSGLIALADALFRAGWIDRCGRLTARVPVERRVEGKWGVAIALSTDQRVALWERDTASLIRAKAAVFAGIRSLVESLGAGGPGIERAYVSGNFGRYLNLPAAVGIGLLPDIPLGRYGYIDNGSLEGAALSLLSSQFFAEIAAYVTRVTYVDLSDLPGYMDEFVGASFLPHTSPDLLRMG
ncbi:MAG: ASKHA domain-containing protein [Candidatus Solibacter sp.]|nr:ASKHA domain-containing protein [Candidatus Solibacter sp.]